MAEITGNEPFMPTGAWGQQINTGLTIRQHFASVAMKGLLSDRCYNYTPKQVAEESVKYADALIKELNK